MSPTRLPLPLCRCYSHLWVLEEVLKPTTMMMMMMLGNRVFLNRVHNVQIDAVGGDWTISRDTTKHNSRTFFNV